MQGAAMVIEPMIRSNVCLNAHPQGCLHQVKAQIEYVRDCDKIVGPKRVLVIGASNGYGLAARIVSTFSCGADTVGVSYEREALRKRTASAGWYNNEAFTQLAQAQGHGVWNINGDAFSQEVKEQVKELVQTHLGQIDFLVYSIAAPRRQDPETGEMHSSVIKPLGQAYTAKTVDFMTGEVSEQTTPPATEQEVANTIKVMGGEDWALWIDHLLEAGLLAPDFLTIAFSYVGPEQTRAIYRNGSIGKAKEDLEQHVTKINARLQSLGGRAVIGIQKALVTRASAVIPAVPLYIALLYRVMKSKGLHENCIEQMVRLYRDFLFSPSGTPTDERGRYRLDDWEMRPDVQQEVTQRWQEATSGNVHQLGDIEGLRAEFLRHHGFGIQGIDYQADVPMDRV
jgi:enoyl-[acyl-carrier protein] reductase/trans-2-enoyl-CoA reductase (NAD+)